MPFKEKLNSWVGAADRSTRAKTAGVFDTLLQGNDPLFTDAVGAATTNFAPSNYINKLIGAEAIGGVTGKLLGDPLSTYSYGLNKALNSGIAGTLNRIKADEMFTQSLVGSAAKGTADIATDLLGTVFKSLKKNIVDSPKRQAILAHLRKTDDIIGTADMTSVLEAYSSMSKFAPKLSTNLSAAKSFLREAVQHEGGIDFMTVKGLAQAERAITGQPIGGN